MCYWYPQEEVSRVERYPTTVVGPTGRVNINIKGNGKMEKLETIALTYIYMFYVFNGRIGVMYD